MNWTAETPTKAGWYWYKRGEHDTTIIEIREDGTIGLREGGRLIAMGFLEFQQRYGPGEWYGPITWTP